MERGTGKKKRKGKGQKEKKGKEWKRERACDLRVSSPGTEEVDAPGCRVCW